MPTTIEILQDAIKEAEEIMGVSVNEHPITVREKAVEILTASIEDPELATARDRISRNLLQGCKFARGILNARIANEKAAA